MGEDRCNKFVFEVILETLRGKLNWFRMEGFYMGGAVVERNGASAKVYIRKHERESCVYIVIDENPPVKLLCDPRRASTLYHMVENRLNPVRSIKMPESIENFLKEFLKT